MRCSSRSLRASTAAGRATPAEDRGGAAADSQGEGVGAECARCGAAIAASPRRASLEHMPEEHGGASRDAFLRNLLLTAPTAERGAWRSASGRRRGRRRAARRRAQEGAADQRRALTPARAATSRLTDKSGARHEHERTSDASAAAPTVANRARRRPPRRTARCRGRPRAHHRRLQRAALKDGAVGRRRSTSTSAECHVGLAGAAETPRDVGVHRAHVSRACRLEFSLLAAEPNCFSPARRASAPRKAAPTPRAARARVHA